MSEGTRSGALREISEQVWVEMEAGSLFFTEAVQSEARCA